MFNTKISYWLFDCIITFENSQLENTVSRRFYTQKPGLNTPFKDFWYKKNKSDSNSINKHLLAFAKRE